MGREVPYRVRKRIRLALIALCVVALALYVLIGAAWTRWSLIAVFAVYVVFHAALWRCPACGASLGNMVVPHNCYNCGEPLEDDGTQAASGR